MTGVVWSFSLRRSVSNKPQSLPFPEHCQSRALAVPWRPRQPHDQGGKPDGLFTVIFSLLKQGAGFQAIEVELDGIVAEGELRPSSLH